MYLLQLCNQTEIELNACKKCDRNKDLAPCGMQFIQQKVAERLGTPYGVDISFGYDVPQI